MKTIKQFILILLLVLCFTRTYAQTDSFQVYPNPFSSIAYFHFYLTQPDKISIDLYNVIGQKIGTDYQDTFFIAGPHTVSFVGDSLKNGIYILKFVAPKSNIITRQLIKTNPTSTIHEKPVYKSELLLFPNPTTGNMHIKINKSHEEGLTLYIYDNTGKLVFSNNYSGANFEFNMSDFDDGVYTISIPDLNYCYKLILVK